MSAKRTQFFRRPKDRQMPAKAFTADEQQAAEQALALLEQAAVCMHRAQIVQVTFLRVLPQEADAVRITMRLRAEKPRKR